MKSTSRYTAEFRKKVLIYLGNHSATKTAERFCLKIDTVLRWQKIVSQFGWGGLSNQKNDSGIPNKLSNTLTKKIERYKSDNPEKTCKQIKQELNLTISISSIARIIKKNIVLTKTKKGLQPRYDYYFAYKHFNGRYQLFLLEPPDGIFYYLITTELAYENLIAFLEDFFYHSDNNCRGKKLYIVTNPALKAGNRLFEKLTNDLLRDHDIQLYSGSKLYQLPEISYVADEPQSNVAEWLHANFHRLGPDNRKLPLLFFPRDFRNLYNEEYCNPLFMNSCFTHLLFKSENCIEQFEYYAANEWLLIACWFKEAVCRFLDSANIKRLEMNRAFILSRLERYDELKFCCEKLENDYPDDWEVAALVGQMRIILYWVEDKCSKQLHKFQYTRVLLKKLYNRNPSLLAAANYFKEVALLLYYCNFRSLSCRYFRQARRCLQQAGHDKSNISVFISYYLAGSLFHCRQYELALAEANNLLTLFGGETSSFAYITGLQLRGVVLRETGDSRQAELLLLEANNIAKHNKLYWSEAISIHALAVLAFGQKLYDKAIALYLECSELYLKLQNYLKSGLMILDLADVYLSMGSYIKAGRTLNRLVVFCRKYKLSELLNYCYMMRIFICIESKNLKDPPAYLQQIAKSKQPPKIQLNIYQQIVLYFQKHQLEEYATEAHRHFDRCYKRYQNTFTSDERFVYQDMIVSMGIKSNSKNKSNKKGD